MSEHLTFGKVAKRITETEGMTGAQALNHLANLLPDDDPERRFIDWLVANAGRLREAAAEMGLDVPAGPGFAARLRVAWLAALAAEEGSK